MAVTKTRMGAAEMIERAKKDRDGTIAGLQDALDAVPGGQKAKIEVLIKSYALLMHVLRQFVENSSGDGVGDGEERYGEEERKAVVIAAIEGLKPDFDGNKGLYSSIVEKVERIVNGEAIHSSEDDDGDNGNDNNDYDDEPYEEDDEDDDDNHDNNETNDNGNDVDNAGDDANNNDGGGDADDEENK